MADHTFEDWTNHATWYVNLTIRNDKKLLDTIKNTLYKDGVVNFGQFILFCEKNIKVPKEVMDNSKERGIVWLEICSELEQFFIENEKYDTPAPIATDALTIISKAIVRHIEGTDIWVLTFTHGRLDRNEYVKVDKLLKALGGKWDKVYSGHVFKKNPTDKIEALLLTGKLTKPTKYGEFFTPEALAKETVAHANLIPGEMVLEPNAGQGALAWPIAKIVGIGNVKCIELQKKNVTFLHKEGFMCREADFLTVKGKTVFPKIVMNPPFEKQADIDHVLHAYNNFLKPGGRLVAIMSGGIKWRDNRKTVEFRHLIESVNGHIIQHPQGSFKVSGTMVDTVTVIMDKPE